MANCSLSEDVKRHANRLTVENISLNAADLAQLNFKGAPPSFQNVGNVIPPSRGQARAQHLLCLGAV